MGCAAGKPTASSPEVSTEVTRENGWQTIGVEKTLEYVKNNSSVTIESERSEPLNESNLDCNDIISGTQGQDRNSEMTETKVPTHQPKRKFTPGVDAPARSIPLKHMNSMATRSQLEFFVMLDRKIAEGPDYTSEAES